MSGQCHRVAASLSLSRPPEGVEHTRRFRRAQMVHLAQLNGLLALGPFDSTHISSTNRYVRHRTVGVTAAWYIYIIPLPPKRG